jgi:hypothetical protein
VRGAQVAGQLRAYLDTVLRWPAVTPTFYAFGRHLDKVSRSYWPGLFHCYDVPGLPRTNNELESHFRDTRRRLLRTTGQQGLTQCTLQHQGAWELLPRPLQKPNYSMPCVKPHLRRWLKNGSALLSIANGSACRADP